jgi:hypothetical protein
MRFEVLMAVTMKFTLFWDMTKPCSVPSQKTYILTKTQLEWYAIDIMSGNRNFPSASGRKLVSLGYTQNGLNCLFKNKPPKSAHLIIHKMPKPSNRFWSSNETHIEEPVGRCRTIYCNSPATKTQEL